MPIINYHFSRRIDKILIRSVLTYKIIRELAQRIGFNTDNYDLTCARAVEGVETSGYKDGKPGRIPVAPVFLGGQR